MAARPASFLIGKPFNLVSLHLEEARVSAIQAAEVEETPTNIGSSAHIMSPNGGFRPPRLYSAAFNQTGSTTGLCPERVLVTPISLSGPTREDATAAISQFRLNLALGSSSSSSQQEEFCFLESKGAVLPTPNGGGNYIPDLNSSLPDVSAPMTEFVREIKSQNISQFTDFVVGYLGEHSSAEEVAEYKKVMSCKTETQLENLDSIRIWNILTLGGKIKKVLVGKGVNETPIRFEDLPFQEEQLMPPPHGYKAPNHVTMDHDFDYNKLPEASWFLDCRYDDETLSDARNYFMPDGDQSSKAKRKAIVAADMGEPYPDDHLQKKKLFRHGEALRIDEPIALGGDKAPNQEAEEDNMPFVSSF